ncbi:MAG: TetR/AcrR family transcriptional regulator [Candidatus Hydrogenedentes bacterium]|nr:TetR/AcrR family transcriptional regulator [Candidatus Hydrogenedentota bacterium]
MTRYATGHAEASRKKIIRAASRIFRERGVKEASVPAIMEAAGMTVGGFYRHFPSKEALFQEALAQSLERTFTLLDHPEAAVAEDAWIEALALLYLSPEHRDNRGRGCPLPALCGDLSREDASTRRIFEEQLTGLIDRLQQRMNTASPEARERSWRLLALLVGGLLLSRSVESETTSNEILAAFRKLSWHHAGIAIPKPLTLRTPRAYNNPHASGRLGDPHAFAAHHSLHAGRGHRSPLAHP